MKWKTFGLFFLALAISGIFATAPAGSPVVDGLIFHVDASSLEGFADGDPVGLWPNLANVGYDAIPNNDDRRPLYIPNALNGHPILRFDGVDDFLVAEDLSLSLLVGDHPFDVFVVTSTARYGGGSHTQPLFGLGRSSGGQREITHLCFENEDQTFNRLVGGAPTFATSIPLDTYTVISNGYGGGGLFNYDMWVDGTVAEASNLNGNTHNFDRGTITIGRPGWNYGASARFAGDVAEMLVFNRYLTVEEKNAVGGYLAWKYGIASAYAPYSPPAENIEPANGDVDVDVDVTLKWKTAVDPENPTVPNPAVTKHFVYMSSAEDANVVLVDTISVDDPAEYAASNLARDTVYYWQIEEGVGDFPPGEPNNILGPVWSFTTVPATPIIDAGFPQDNLVDAGTDVILVAVATNPFSLDDANLEYQWYNEAGDAIADNDTFEGASTSQLTIKDADVLNEGLYKCIVKVLESGKTGETPQALVTIKRKIGHWAFDSDLEDSVYGNNGTTASADPNYAAGIVDDGLAVDFAAGAEAVQIPTDAHINSAFTLTWWDNANVETSGGTWESMLASGPTSGYEIFEADRYQMQRYAFGYSVSGGSYAYTPDSEEDYIARGQWIFHALTYDATGQISSWYINGVKFADFEGVEFAAFDAMIFVGNCRDASQPYVGLIDDLQLYNYPLDPYTIAGMYNTVTEETVCVENPEGDLDGDCRVTLTDIAMFIATWLDCNRVPSCIN